VNGPRKRLPAPPAAPLVEVAERVARALDALAAVHRLGPVGMCAECMVPFPCHTRVIVDEAVEAVKA
jgi:hypothetical protein